jgi:hypothetical protein
MITASSFISILEAITASPLLRVDSFALVTTFLLDISLPGGRVEPQLEAVYIDYGLGKCLWCLLRQVVSDTATDQEDLGTVLIFEELESGCSKVAAYAIQGRGNTSAAPTGRFTLAQPSFA